MACLREFKARLESDAAFREKFKRIKTENEVIALAEVEGYDLTRLCDDELDNVAGGTKTKEDIKREWNTIRDILSWFGF